MWYKVIIAIAIAVVKVLADELVKEINNEQP